MTRFLFLFAGMLAYCGPAWAQDKSPRVQGEWHMELRTVESPGVISEQEEITLIVSDKTAEGTYVVLAHVTIHAIMDAENLLARPECRGKSECRFSDGSEGVGRLIGDKFYVDWIDEGWIDDIFTVSGDKMTGDDGNGPINLTRIE